MDLLARHRALVATRSVSGQEGPIADLVEGWLREHPVHVERIGDNVVARRGRGPLLLLCSHLDTVPPTPAWTRDPWEVEVVDGAVYGLGSNDAKASVAAMIDAFLGAPDDLGLSIGLLLAPQEETGGDGVEKAWPILRERGWEPAGVVVGEPTDLQIAVAQKGMLCVELHAEGDACHSANATALGARNPIAALARDLVALDGLDLGPPDPDLGRTTLQPTVIRGGEVRNQVPALATVNLDLRTVPTTPHRDLVDRIGGVVGSSIHLRSERLAPYRCPDGAAIVAAATRARPQSHTFGSATMSDLVWFAGLPGIKCGPGVSARSHRPDEFVREDEVRDGAAFYAALIREFAALA